MMASQETTPDEWSELLRGWRAELAALAREHAFWKSDPASTFVAFGADGVTVSRGNAAHEAALVRLPDASGLALAVTRADAASRDVAVRLPQSEVLRANVWLPKASTATLRQALSFELERLSPVDPAHLYFDFAAVGRDTTANRVELALRIVRRTVVDEALAQVHGAGLRVSGIAFAGEGRLADPKQFPVDRPAYYRFLWRKWNLAVLAGLAALLALAALFAWYGRNAAAQDMLAEQVFAEQRRAAIVGRIQSDIARTEHRIGFLARQKEAPLATATLAELARIMPDGTWLNEVEIDGARLHVRGYSHAAADLIGAIDRDPMFANAQFGAPLVRNPSGNVEQFDLVFDLKGPHK